MAKKAKCPEFENHERWLVAFADMMTLLFALFVVLYAMANQDKAKTKAVSESVQKAFGIAPITDELSDSEGRPRGNSRTEGIFRFQRGNTRRKTLLVRNQRELAAIIATDAGKLERQINDRLYGNKMVPDGTGSEKKDDRVIFVNRDNDGIRVTLLARKFFNPNETILNPEAKKALAAVALAIKDMGRTIRVEGHTDNIPFSMNGLTNWELSGNRAATVVRYLIKEQGFDPETIYPAGFADTHPLAPNDTPENRALNRRVDLKILYDYTTPEFDDEEFTPPTPENKK